MQAADDTWKAGVSGIFTANANWTDNSSPTSSDSATFGVEGVYAVSFVTSPTVQNLFVNAGDVTFQSSGGLKTLTVFNTSQGNVRLNGGNLSLGTLGNPMALSVNAATAVSRGTLTVGHGSQLSSVAYFPGDSTGATGNIVVDGAGSSLNGTFAKIGFNSGTSTLTVRNNSTAALADYVELGSGTPLINSLGRLHVLNGGTASTKDMRVGNLNVNGQRGEILVDGVGSAITQTGAGILTVGASNAASGALMIRNGGSYATGTGLTTINETGLIDIDSGSAGGFTARGNILLKGFVRRTSGTFSIPQAARLDVLGGTLEVFGDLVFDGGQQIQFAGASAYLEHVTGGGLTLSNSTTMTIIDGAHVELASTTLESGASITISGGSANLGMLTNNLNRVTLNAGHLRVQNDQSSFRSFLNGSNTIQSRQSLDVGGAVFVSPVDTLAIDGGRLEAETFLLNGTLDMRAGGLIVRSDLTIDNAQSGTPLVLPNQAAIDVFGTTSVASSLTVDGGRLVTGRLVNHGTTSIERGSLQAELGIQNVLGGLLFIGENRTLSTGGESVNDGTIILGGGGAVLRGASLLTNNGLIRGEGVVATSLANGAAGELRAESAKTLAILGPVDTNLGKITLQGGTIQFAEPLVSSATAIITGRGTLFFDGSLTNAGKMQFSGGPTDIYGDVSFTGGAGGGEIINSGGGNVVTFYGNVEHNGDEIRTSPTNTTVFFGNVTGAGPFTGTGAVRFEGTFMPGNSPGQIAMDVDVKFTDDALLVMELSGASDGEYDQLQISGLLSLGGILEVTLQEGFSPRSGDRFNLLDFGALTGQFDAVRLPNLIGSLDWDTARLYQDGSLSVIPEPGALLLMLAATMLLGARRFVRSPAA
jgi:T5SS/PEP-CTERM-associated repeat protein